MIAIGESDDLTSNVPTLDRMGPYRFLGLFSSLGGATNSAIHKYVNEKKIPHLFIATNLTRWADPQHFLGTIQASARRLSRRTSL